ncbi:MAG: methyltransferase domain-containing protein [Candidatus Heimdallarchaeota archaeon]
MKIPRLDIAHQTFSQDIWRRFCSRYGEHRARKLLDSLSKPVKQYAIRVTTTLVSRDSLIEEFIELGWKARAHKLLKEMFTIETKGPHKIPYLSRAPRIILDKLAAESVLVGADLYGVGIKRVPKFEIGYVVSLISDKDQIIAIGESHINSRTHKKHGLAVSNNHSLYNVPSLNNLGYIDSGKLYSQSIPAAYVSHVLDPKPNEIIVDLCAAPGGKSTGAAILSNKKAKIIAFDRSKKRLDKMQKIVSSQMLDNVQLIHANSINYFKEHNIRADKVIVDPSCTAIGVRPKVYDDTLIDDIQNSANYQKAFLWTANKIVKKGGVITYSTCTLAPEENEKVVAYAVNKLGLKLVGPDLKMGSSGEDTGDGLELEAMRRFYPDIHDTPGFFVAKLTK